MPEHFHIEILAALRTMRIRGDQEEHMARIALGRVQRLRAERYPVLDLQPEIWALRHSLTAYDAAYLALARRLDLQLVTTGSRARGGRRRRRTSARSGLTSGFGRPGRYEQHDAVRLC